MRNVGLLYVGVVRLGLVPARGAAPLNPFDFYRPWVGAITGTPAAWPNAGLARRRSRAMLRP